jgi:hypothetical protein
MSFFTIIPQPTPQYEQVVFISFLIILEQGFILYLFAFEITAIKQSFLLSSSIEKETVTRAMLYFYIF